jgi:hypothetical protein
VTGAKIHVSSPDEVYPGTNDRSDLGPDACNNPHQNRYISLSQRLICEDVEFFCMVVDAGCD